MRGNTRGTALEARRIIVIRTRGTTSAVTTPKRAVLAGQNRNRRGSNSNYPRKSVGTNYKKRRNRG